VARQAVIFRNTPVRLLAMFTGVQHHFCRSNGVSSAGLPPGTATAAHEHSSGASVPAARPQNFQRKAVPRDQALDVTGRQDDSQSSALLESLGLLLDPALHVRLLVHRTPQARECVS
jgi:hypothetical protein